MTPNDKLPEETEKQIQQQAFKSVNEMKGERRASFLLGYEAGYNEGATAWAPWYIKHTAIESELHGVRAENERLKKGNQELQAQAWCMADALKLIITDIGSLCNDDIFDAATTAYRQFKDGGKEAGPTEQEIEAEITRRWNGIGYNPIGTRKRESYREEVVRDLTNPTK